MFGGVHLWPFRVDQKGIEPDGGLRCHCGHSFFDPRSDIVSLHLWGDPFRKPLVAYVGPDRHSDTSARSGSVPVWCHFLHRRVCEIRKSYINGWCVKLNIQYLNSNEAEGELEDAANKSCVTFCVT